MELCYPANKKELKEYLGEAIHTAFRKATDCPQAQPIWKLIQEMPEEAWDSVLEFIMLDDFDYGLVRVIEQRQELYEAKTG